MNDQVFPFHSVDLDVEENQVSFTFITKDIYPDFNIQSLSSNVRIIDLDSMTYNIHDDEAGILAFDSNRMDSLDENICNIFDIIPKTSYVIQPPCATDQPLCLSLLSLNIVSIPDKFQNFLDSLDSVSDIDIYGFCETRLNTDIECLYSIPSYEKFHQQGRPKPIGGPGRS